MAIIRKKKDTQTGDQPICVSYQEEGEMKKNCYAYYNTGGILQKPPNLYELSIKFRLTFL